MMSWPREPNTQFNFILCQLERDPKYLHSLRDCPESPTSRHEIMTGGRKDRMCVDHFMQSPCLGEVVER